MKIIVAYSLFAIFAFQMGCNSSAIEQKTSDISADPREEIPSPIPKPDIQREEFNPLGCWFGDRGGALVITNGKIDHLTPNRKISFSYTIRPHSENSDNGVLLELKDISRSEFLKQFVFMKYEGKDETLGNDKVLLRGYETFADFEGEKFKSSEYFHKDSCKKLK